MQADAERLARGDEADIEVLRAAARAADRGGDTRQFVLLCHELEQHGPEALAPLRDRLHAVEEEMGRQIRARLRLPGTLHA